MPGGETANAFKEIFSLLGRLDSLRKTGFYVVIPIATLAFILCRCMSSEIEDRLILQSVSSRGRLPAESFMSLSCSAYFR